MSRKKNASFVWMMWRQNGGDWSANINIINNA